MVTPRSTTRIGVRNASTEEPVSLELGGKSAAIILDDADLDLARIGQDLFAATLVNNGQTCYADARILAPRSRYDEVVDTFYISKGTSDGARLVAGGGRPAGLDRGWFVEPTVFADVDNKSTIAQEEIFGPVLSVIAYTDTDDAIQIANDSDYGLGGSVWTTDPDRARSVVRRVRTGTMGINGYLPDPAGPWGGVKSSALAANSARAQSPPSSSSKPFTPNKRAPGAGPVIRPGFTEPGRRSLAVNPAPG